MLCVGKPDLPIMAGSQVVVSKVGRTNCHLSLRGLDDSFGNSFVPTSEFKVNYVNDQATNIEFTSDGSRVRVTAGNDQTIPADLSAATNNTVFNVVFIVNEEFITSDRASTSGVVGAKVMLQINDVAGENLPQASLSEIYNDVNGSMLHFFWVGNSPTFEDDFVSSGTVDIRIWRPWANQDPTSYAQFLAAPAHTTTAKTLTYKRCANDAPPAGFDISQFTDGCIWYSMPYKADAVPNEVEVFAHALVKTGVDAAIFHSNQMTYTDQ